MYHSEFGMTAILTRLSTLRKRAHNPLDSARPQPASVSRWWYITDKCKFHLVLYMHMYIFWQVARSDPQVYQWYVVCFTAQRFPNKLCFRSNQNEIITYRFHFRKNKNKNKRDTRLETGKIILHIIVSLANLTENSVLQDFNQILWRLTASTIVQSLRQK